MMYSPLFFATVALAQITEEQYKELSMDTKKNRAGKANWDDYFNKHNLGAVDENAVKERAVLPTLGEKLPAPAPAPAPAPKTMTTPPEPKAEKIYAPKPATKMVYGAKSSNQNQQANKGLKKAKGNPPKGEPEAPVKPEVPVPEVPVKPEAPVKLDCQGGKLGESCVKCEDNVDSPCETNNGLGVCNAGGGCVQIGCEEVENGPSSCDKCEGNDGASCDSGTFAGFCLSSTCSECALHSHCGYAKTCLFGGCVDNSFAKDFAGSVTPGPPVKLPVPEVPVKHDMPEKMETKSADMKKVGFYTESIKDYLRDEADLDTFFKEIKVATNEKYQKDPEMQMRYKNAEDNASKLGEQYKFWKHYKNGKFSASLMNALKKEYKDFFV